MEKEENEQLIEFIRGSHERIREAFMYIEGDNVAAAAYLLGQLDCLHATLLDLFEEENDEAQEACCPMDEFIKKGFKISNACQNLK